jgi:putative PEP-CTERM system TPR-repeat lipoprotein
MSQRNNKIVIFVSFATSLILGATLAGCGNGSTEAQRAQARQQQLKSEFRAAVITLKNASTQSPDEPETRYQLATVYLDTGDALSAEKEIRLALKLGFRTDAAMPVLGRSLVLQGQFQKVLDETAREAEKNGAELLCVRADAYLAMGRPDDASRLYESVLLAHPSYPPALTGLGRVAYMARDVKKANQYAALALAAAPRNTDVLLFQGDLRRAENQPALALAAYDKVLSINPAHRSAYVEKAYLEIGMGRFEAAQAALDSAKDIAPASVLVAYTQALLDFSQGKNADAQVSLQKVLRAAPEHMPTVLLAGALCLNLGSLHQAEHHLRHYLEKNPNNVYARKMLAQTLLRSGHSPDALEVLSPALADSQQDGQLLALAGESYMQARNFNKAEEFFEKASALDPKAANLRTSVALSKLAKGEQAQAVSDLRLATKLDAKSQQAGMALVRTELGLEHFDNALAAVLALEHEQPGVAAVEDLKGMVYIGKRDAAQARAQFRKALVTQPSYFPAAANLAQLDMRENNPAGARRQLQAFVDKNPASIEGMTALASLDQSEGKIENATKWLERASAAQADAVAPAVNLMGQYLRTGATQKALDLARKLLVTHPGEPDLLDLLGRGFLANGQQEDALATYKELALALPRSAYAQMQVAAIQVLLKRYGPAEDSLKTALALQPDFPAAQLALAELYARKGSNELALMMADRMQAAHPRAAAGFQLEGDVLMGQGKPARALPAFERALAFSTTSELIIKTANAQRLAGKPAEAAARLGLWLRQHPADVRVQLFIASNLSADKQYKLAAAQLESALKLQPANVAALNNLALAYQMAKDPRAQHVAEQAYALAKEIPTVMDTLGWILVDQGDAARGLAILQQASARATQAPDIRYHMAMGLFKTGNKDAARKELELLAAGDMRFAQADEARALLKQLQ